MEFKKIDFNLKRVLKRRRREAQWAKEDGIVKPSRIKNLGNNIGGFTSSRPFKLYLWSIFALSLLAVSIIATVSLVKKRNLKVELAKEATFVEFVNQSTEILKISDLAIPNSFKGEEEKELILYREPMKAWTKEMIEPFKDDSRAIAEDLLSKHNEELIQEILSH